MLHTQGRPRPPRDHRHGGARAARRRPDLGQAAAARGHAGHLVPRHADHRAVRGLDPGGDGGTGGAPGRGGARDAVGHQGNPGQRAVRPGDLHRAVRLGSRRGRRRVRGAHEARLDPAAAAGGRRPAADVRLQLRRPAGGRDPHLVRQGPDRPVRDAGEVPAAADRAHRGRRARRAAGRAATRGAHPRRSQPARRLQRRRAPAPRPARAEQLLGERRRDHGEQLALHGAPDRRIQQHRRRAQPAACHGRAARRHRAGRAGLA